MDNSVNYIADTTIGNNSAYNLHVMKMCDAFSLVGKNVNLFIPNINDELTFPILKKKFLLRNKKKFKIIKILNYNIKNFIDRLIFGFKVAFVLRNKKKELILTRSVSSSIFLSLFKIPHYLELHSEIESLTKFFMFNLNFINSKYIIKKILISKALNKKFKFKDNEVLILHDCVDVKNFGNFKRINKIKNLSYIGSFHKGKGIELILKLAKKFSRLNFNIYGQPIKKIINTSKNIKFHGHIDYCDVPHALSNSDVLLLPSAKLQFGRSKNTNISAYNSPLKMFDYLASGKIILASKREGICEILKHKKNAIIVNKYNAIEWSKEIKKILKKKYNLSYLQKKALITAANFTWFNRVKSIIDDKKSNR